MDWNLVFDIVIIALGIALGYAYPKIRALNKTIYLNQKQKEAAKKFIAEFKKAVADGKITPQEQIQLIKQFESIFETQRTEEIEQIIEDILAYLRTR